MTRCVGVPHAPFHDPRRAAGDGDCRAGGWWWLDRWQLDRARSEAVRDASYLAFHLHNGIIRGGDSAMEVEQLLSKYPVWKAAKSPNRP